MKQMKRTLISALLALAMVLTLLPSAALAEEMDIVGAPETSGLETPVETPEEAPSEETDEVTDIPEIDRVEMPVEMPVEVSMEAPAAEADTVVDASELEYFEIPLIDPRYPSASPIDNSEGNPNAVELADKRAAKCIDRVKLPQFARDLYNTLERESKPAGSSGLGRDGVLIDPSLSPNTQRFTSGEAYVLRTSFPTESALRNSGFRFADYKEFIYNCALAAYYAFCSDHPEVFWADGFSSYTNTNDCFFDIVLAYKGFPSNMSKWDIRAEGYQDSSAIKRDLEALNESVDSVLRGAGRASSNFDKITYFNEWLTTNNQYNYTIAYTNGSADRTVYTSLGALTTKDGRPGSGRVGRDGPVCSGYAKAFQLLCQEADIPCVYVSGAAHAWNYVQPDPSDSRWYAVDVTWNDPVMWGTPTFEEYAKLGANSNMESTAYTLVGANTIVYPRKAETFLDQHPEENVIGGGNYVHADFRMGPELNKLAYVDSVVIKDLDAPVKGAVPDTSVTLTSAPKSGHHPTASGTEELLTRPVVTWSPAPVNGKFAADTTYTATISYTPLRQGYGLTAADASKITVAGADKVTVSSSGAIQAVFEASGAKAEDFTCKLPTNLVYDGSSKTAAVRNSVSSSIHNGWYTLVFTDEKNNTVTDLVKPGTYQVIARVSAHVGYAAADVSLGTVSIQEAPGLHGKVTVSVGDASQGGKGEAYAARNEVIVVHVAPDPGYRLSSIKVIRADNGRTVSLSGGGDRYTFPMPESDVSVQAVFAVN